MTSRQAPTALDTVISATELLNQAEDEIRQLRSHLAATAFDDSHVWVAHRSAKIVVACTAQVADQLRDLGARRGSTVS